jgi:hypothetical protein
VTNPAVTVRNLSKSYGGRTVVSALEHKRNSPRFGRSKVMSPSPSDLIAKAIES